MPDDFFPALISGIGVLLGFTLASQIVILFQLIVLPEANTSKLTHKYIEVFIISSWFCTIISIFSVYCLWILSNVISIDYKVEVAQPKVVESAYCLYLSSLILIVIFQIFCSALITFPKCRERFPLTHINRINTNAK